MVLILFLIGCKELTQEEAERLALEELRNLMLNDFEKQKVELYSDYPPNRIAAYEEYIQGFIRSLQVVYSVKKGDAWSVFITIPKGERSIEVIVYSKNNIQIPQFEEALRGIIKK